MVGSAAWNAKTFPDFNLFFTVVISLVSLPYSYVISMTCYNCCTDPLGKEN